MKTTLQILILLFSFNAFSAQITQIKGSKVMLELGNSKAQVGSEYYTVSPAGKKTAIIKIIAIKNGKATGEITKGKAVLGSDIAPKVTATAAPPSPARPKKESTVVRTRKGKLAGGALLGLASNTMSLTAQNTWNPSIPNSVTLTGMTYNVKGFVDYDLSPAVTIRAATGLETFGGKGSAKDPICGTSTSPTTNCEVSFSYLGFEGSIHWNFLTGKSKAWIGAGYQFQYLMSKSTNIPNLDTSGSFNHLGLFSVGYDWGLSAKSFIPIVLEYGLYFSSSTVKANSIYLRAGYGLSF